jgi:hypothetical protein
VESLEQMIDLVEVDVKCRHWMCGAQYSQTLQARPIGCYFPPVRCDVCGRLSITLLLIKVKQETRPSRVQHEAGARFLQAGA